MKRTPLNQRSSNRAREERIYNRRVKQWKKENPFCEACAITADYRAIHEYDVYNTVPRLTEDCHHTAGKNHGLLLIEKWWLPVCRSCHDWITTHGKAARYLGLTIDLPVEMGLKTR